jgi:hypothetical protein
MGRSAWMDTQRSKDLGAAIGRLAVKRGVNEELTALAGIKPCTAPP